MSRYSPSGSSGTLSPSLSPSTPQDSSYYDDSSDIDELDHRSRKITHLLKKNLDKSSNRSNLLDVVKRRAWLLGDQVNRLEQQTIRAKSALGRKSFRRRLIMFGAFMSSVLLVGFGVNHMATNSRE